MIRSVLSASLVMPVWQHGAFRVEGLDEDAFTLGLGALRQLGPQLQTEGARALRRLHVVGSFPSEVEWAFGEALGIPLLEVRRHAPSAPALWGALAAAAHDEGSNGREAVVAADLASISVGPSGSPVVQGGAGAVAFLLGSEPGLAVLQHGFHGHPAGRPPSIKGVVSGWLNALDLPKGRGAGEAVLSVEYEAARWSAIWEEMAPGISVTLVDTPANGAGSMVHAARLLWELGRRLRTGALGVVGESVRGRSGFAGFRLDGPVRWLGSWGPGGPGLHPSGGKFLERNVTLNAVSQGAYVPYPRYLENLASRWRLVGERCLHCHALTFPMAGRCRSCGRSGNAHAETLSRDGLEVVAVTTISPGAQPTEFDPMVEAGGGYDVALLSLGPECRATVQVTDTLPGQLRVGDRVGLVLRRLYPMEGEWRYGLKAVPERSDVGSPGVGLTVHSPARRRQGPSSSVPTGRRATPRERGGPKARRRRPGR
jgi:uncharacterized OB-fold protein